MLLMVGGMFAALFLLFLVVLSANTSWNNDDWNGLFLGLGIAGLILYTGHAFSAFRKKEPSINYLMLPASTMEKFTFELVNRFLLYVIGFPLLFVIASHFAAFFATPLSEGASFQGYHLFTAMKVLDQAPDYVVYVMASMILLTVSTGFAGASTFGKYPLVKTVALVAAMFMLVGGYFFIVIKIFSIEMGLAYVSKTWFDSEQLGATVFIAFAFISTLVTLGYGFFKLKEKEVA